jgi:hypothetical protein
MPSLGVVELSVLEEPPAHGEEGEEAALVEQFGAVEAPAVWWHCLVTPARATSASWLVNVFLLAAKLVVFFVSNSKAVLASLADSAGAQQCASAHLGPTHAPLFQSTWPLRRSSRSPGAT